MTRTPRTIAYWEGRLPHWEVEDGRYFITIHLAGAIPIQGRERVVKLAEQARAIDKSQGSDEWLTLQRKIFLEMEDWLDRAEWNPRMRRPEVAQMVVEAIEHRNKRGDWRQFEYVVMPTHVHMFCEIGEQRMKKVLEDFKRWTGHQAGKILKLDGSRFWQREWFDHWSRSDDEDERIATYIRENPVKAGLVENYLAWLYGSWSARTRGLMLGEGI